MISKEQWQAVEVELAAHFVSLTFQLKSNELKVSRVQMSENKTALAVYINGEISLGWGYPFGEGIRPLVVDVWRKRTKAAYPPSEKKKLIKDLGKRQVKKYFPEIDKVHVYYDPCFNTAKSLVNQFKKLQDLTLVSEVEAPICN